MILGLVIVLWLVVLSGPTFTFMRTEQVRINSVTFPSSNSAVISVTNMGDGNTMVTGPDFSPILIASLIARFATVALVANKSYNRTSPAGLPLKPPPILKKKNIITAVLVVVIILSSITALYLLYEYLFPPLTFALARTEESKIVSFTFPSSRSAATNTGSNAVTISRVTIDDVLKIPTYGGSIRPDGTLANGESGTITISNWTWVSGRSYTFAIFTVSGSEFTYVTTAGP